MTILKQILKLRGLNHLKHSVSGAATLNQNSQLLKCIPEISNEFFTFIIFLTWNTWMARAFLGRCPASPFCREKCPARERWWPDDGCPVAKILHMQQEQEQAGMNCNCKSAAVGGGTECNGIKHKKHQQDGFCKILSSLKRKHKLKRESLSIALQV